MGGLEFARDNEAITGGLGLPEDVHGLPGSRLYVHNVQQVLQDVEQLFEAQVRTTSVQVSLVSIRCVQGLHSTRPSGRTTLQGHVTEHLNLPLRAFSDPRLPDAVSDCLNSRRSFLVPACSSSGNGFRIDDETTGV